MPTAKRDSGRPGSKANHDTVTSERNRRTSTRHGTHFLKMFSELQALEIWFVSLEFRVPRACACVDLAEALTSRVLKKQKPGTKPRR